MLRIISGLLVGVWVARYLGPEHFGVFSYVLAFTAIFGGIAKLGLDGIVVRELVKFPEKRDYYLGTAFWLKVFGAIIVLMVVAMILPFADNNYKTNIYIYIISLGLVFQSFEVVEFYFQAKVWAKFISICKVVQLLISGLIKVFLIFINAELLFFVLVASLDVLFLGVCYYIAYKLKVKSSFFRFFNLNIAFELIKNSWPLIFSSLVIMIYMRIDQIMLKEISGAYEVGIYSAAVRLSEAFYFIPMIITSSLFPLIIKNKMKSEFVYIKGLRYLYTFLVWLAIIISVPMFFLSDWIVDFFFGSLYKQAAKVLVINIWASIFVFLGVAFSRFLLVENMTKAALSRTFFGAIVNIILNFWLIPLYGAVGAAFSTLIAQFAANIAYDIFDKRLHPHLIIKIQAIFAPWKVFEIKKTL